MKHNIKRLLILSTVSLASFFISSCKFNYVESSYLKRPDVEIKNAGIVIRGAYISSDSSYINVYRQDVSISDTGPVENVAILFPKGDTHDNQTYMYVAETIIKDAKYRYYVRFADSKGNRNRTEWSEEISNPNSTYTDAIKFKYSFEYFIFFY